jgi:hypothetical protein
MKQWKHKGQNIAALGDPKLVSASEKTQKPSGVDLHEAGDRLVAIRHKLETAARRVLEDELPYQSLVEQAAWAESVLQEVEDMFPLDTGKRQRNGNTKGNRPQHPEASDTRLMLYIDVMQEITGFKRTIWQKLINLNERLQGYEAKGQAPRNISQSPVLEREKEAPRQFSPSVQRMIESISNSLYLSDREADFVMEKYQKEALEDEEADEDEVEESTPES